MFCKFMRYNLLSTLDKCTIKILYSLKKLSSFCTNNFYIYRYTLQNLKVELRE